MIGKTMTGRSFGGCIRYVVGKQDAVILDAAGVRMQQVNQMINDFNLQRKYNLALGKAVGHIALSWSVNDLAKLDDEVMLNLAKEYLEKMKIRETQYLIVKHQDKSHPHLHIVYNRVDNSGKTISDNFQRQRNVQVAKEMTLKHGFYLSPGKEDVNRDRLKGRDKVKYELYDAIRLASKKVKNITELQQALSKQGITLQLKYKSGSTEVQGISFSKGEYKFKGSEIDRSMSYAKLSTAIEGQQQMGPEKSLADQLREAVQNARQESGDTQKPEQQTDYPQTGLQSQYLKTMPDLDFVSNDPGFDIGISDDIDDEAILGRNRHRKKQARTNTR
ncbi:relaxase/mobilization nuclease domain-containing protein [Mucilaginibacter sp.]|uniref:relaxase/mobilization nuclease domain-containing protein n=1 Tax=Mucilaginibacter sp. TaxID=1882438 RepID=UPI003AFFA982